MQFAQVQLVDIIILQKMYLALKCGQPRTSGYALVLVKKSQESTRKDIKLK